jgi:hypothetical protein
MNRRAVWPVILTAALLTGVLAACSSSSGGSAAPGEDAGSECMPINPPTTCPSPPPSYASEIAPIVALHCAGTGCHSPGGAESVHDFTTQQGLHDDRLTVAQQVSLCPTSSSGMPPPGYPQLTTAQRTELIAWASVCMAPNN